MRKRSKLVLLLLALGGCINCNYAQVGINTDDPDPNALLDIKSTEKGVLVPRVTTAQRDAMTPGESNGLTVYNVSTNCYSVWNSDVQSWTELCPEQPAITEFENCEQIVISGAYDLEKPTSQQELKIEMTLNVVKMGKYSYSAECNGITFTAIGSFINIGPSKVIFYLDPAASNPGNEGTYEVAFNLSHLNGTGNPNNCNASIKFLKRSTATLKILNVAGDQNGTGLTSTGGNDSSSSSYRSVGKWLTGGALTVGSTPAAHTALYYAGTQFISLIDVVPFNSTATLKEELKDASIVWIGASEKYSYGFSQVLREWFEAGKGIVIITGDKQEESIPADYLGYYVEDGSASAGTTYGRRLPEVFSTSQDAPFEVTDGMGIGYSGNKCGYVSSNQGVVFMTVTNSNKVFNSAIADIENGVFILGDKFGNPDHSTSYKDNFTKVLADIFAWSLKNAPIH